MVYKGFPCHENEAIKNSDNSPVFLVWFPFLCKGFSIPSLVLSEFPVKGTKYQKPENCAIVLQCCSLRQGYNNCNPFILPHINKTCVENCQLVSSKRCHARAGFSHINILDWKIKGIFIHGLCFL